MDGPTDVVFVISSACHGAGNCVGVGRTKSGGVILRDAFGSTVSYSADEWIAFLAGVKSGEFDLALLPRGAHA